MAGEPPQADGGLARVLGPREVGRGRGLVGQRDPGCAQLAALGVAPAAPVLERGQAGAADRHVALAMAPGAAERVGDHDGGGDAGQLAQCSAQPSRRAVGVLGQQDQPMLAAGIGRVDAGVRAHEAVAGAADQHPALGPEQVLRLVEHHLHCAGILVLRGRQLAGARARLDLGQVADTALGLGHHLVGDGEHVAVARGVLPGGGGRQQGGEVVAGAHLRESGDRRGGQRHRSALRSARARSTPGV